MVMASGTTALRLFHLLNVPWGTELRRVAMRAERRGMITILAGALTVGSLLLVSCSGDLPLPDPANPQRRSPGESTTLEGFAKRGLPDGTVWLLIGQRANRADVYSVDPNTGAVKRWTEREYGVTWLSASEKGVVISDSISGPEVPSVLNDGRPVPLETGKAGRARAFTPSIHPDGRIVFTRVIYPKPGAGGARVSLSGSDTNTDGMKGPAITPTPRSSPSWLRWEVVVKDWDGEEFDVIYASQVPVSGTAWGPEGHVAVTEAVDQNGLQNIVVIGADGETDRIADAIGLNRIGDPVWSTVSGTPLAIREPGGGDSVLVDIDDGAHTPLPKGWTARCWDPAGEHLIVSRKREIAMVHRDRPDEVTIVETLPASMGTLYNCGWGPADP